MKKKSFLLCGIAAVLGIAASGTLLTANGLKKNFNEISAEEVSYKMVAGKDQFAALGTSFARVGGFAMSSSTGTAVQVNVVNGKKDGNNLVLGKLGKVFNFGPSSTNYYSAITSIKSVKVTFSSGDLSLKLATRTDGMELGQPVTLISGVGVAVTKGGVNYFSLETVAGATIESIEVVYSCTATAYDSLDYLGGTTWTAQDSSGFTYRLKCATDGTFELDSLDKEENDHFSGTYEKTTEGKIKASFKIQGKFNVSIFFNERNSHSSLDFDSVTDDVGGAIADGIAHFNFKRVYMIEDFESYSETGTGYTANNAESNRSGLQGAFFADYGGGGSGSPVGTSGFQLMGSTDFIQLDKTNKYEGNQAGKFKGSTGGWMRYWGYDQLIGEPYPAGSGAYISMWVKNNSNVSAKLKWGSMTTYAALNDTTRNSLDYATPTIPANQDWTEYTVPLTKTSYGWYLGIEKTSGSNAYLSIDNVCIYTDSPYVEYVEPVNPNLRTFTAIGTLPTSATAQDAGVNGLNYFLSLGKNGESKMFLLGEVVEITKYDVDGEGNVELTTNFSKEVMGDLFTITLTKVTGKFNAAGTAIENVALTGSGLSAVLEATSGITLNEYNANLIDFEGATTAQVQSMYKRWYHDGSKWVEDTGNTDRMEVVADDGINGASAMKIRGYNKFRVTMAADTEETFHVNGMGLWIKNVGTKPYTFKWFYFTSKNYATNSNPGSKSVPADGEWHYYQCGCNVDCYNFSLYFEGSGAQATDKVLVDYIHLY